MYKGSKHQTNTLLSPDTIQCTRGQNIKHILYYPQTLYSVQGVKTSNKILYYPQTLYSVQGGKTSNTYFIIPRHYTVYKGSKHQTKYFIIPRHSTVYKESKHQTHTLLSPDTIQCTRSQNIKHILYYPQTLYSVQGVKTSNKYFIIPRHSTVYKGSKHQTNTLLSPDTIQCTRGQNIKQILYHPQTLYSVQGVKTTNKYFIIPRHYTVYKGSKHQTNTLLSPDTIQCTRGQNIKQILYYPQTLYSVQGVKTTNTYFIIPRHYTVYKGKHQTNTLLSPEHYTVYKGSKHQTHTLLSPDTLQCTRGQNIKHILYYPQTLYSVQGVKTSNTYFIIPRHSTVYKGSKHQTHTLLSPDTIQCTRGQNIKQILYYPQTLYSVQGVKTSNKILYYPQTLYSVQGVKTSNKILYYPQTLYSVQGVKTSNKYIAVRHLQHKYI